MAQVRALVLGERHQIIHFWQRTRERLENSLILIPAIFLVGAVLLALLLREVDNYLELRTANVDWWRGSSVAAINVTTVIATSMLTFLGVVFSVTLVALQLASQQFSPRVLRIFVRSETTKVALGTLMATFAYSLILLAEAIRSGQEKVPLISLSVALLSVFASLIVFIIFVRAILEMIRVAYIISLITKETASAIADNCPPTEAYILCQETDLSPIQTTISFTTRPGSWLRRSRRQGIFQAVDKTRLVDLAQAHDCRIQLLAPIGSYLLNGDPVVTVYGSSCPAAAEILATFDTGPERALYQDPAYGFRQLVDIASQALSPAINAPTTAVQVIDRLVDLLAQLAGRPAPTGIYTDTNEQLRLVMPVTSWEEYVNLAFEEIRVYGAKSPQVRQHLPVSLERLLARVPESHRPALAQQKGLLPLSAVSPELKSKRAKNDAD